MTDARPTGRARLVLLVNAVITVVVVVVGLWVGATRNPLGYLVVALAIVLFLAMAMRARRRSG